MKGIGPVRRTRARTGLDRITMATGSSPGIGKAGMDVSNTTIAGTAITIETSIMTAMTAAITMIAAIADASAYRGGQVFFLSIVTPAGNSNIASSKLPPTVTLSE